MKVILRDHDTANSGWPDALKTHFEKLEAGGSSETPDKAIETTPQAIIFLHYSNDDNRDYWINNLHPTSYIVLVNRKGRTKDRNLPARVLACYWTPREFAEKNRPKRFADNINKGENIDWSLLHPPPEDITLAARLLSQAAAYCKETAAEAGSGVKIYPPPHDLSAKAARALADLEKGFDVAPAITTFEEEMRKIQTEV